jgi:hypothetical protein
MALSSANKAKVRRFLGYPDVNRLAYQPMEGALTALSPDGETLVVALLTSLEALHAALQGSWSRQKVLKAEDVTLAGDGELIALRAEGRRLSGELAATFDVPIFRDIWGGSQAAGVARRG